MAITNSVVQIVVSDESGRNKTFNIDNPKSELTLGQINNALMPAFSGRWWLGNTGAVINKLVSANYSTSTKIQIGGQIVSLTPATAEANNPGINYERAVVLTFNVDGGDIQSANFDPKNDQHVKGIVNFTNNTVTLRIFLDGTTIGTTTATTELNVIVNNVALKSIITVTYGEG